MNTSELQSSDLPGGAIKISSDTRAANLTTFSIGGALKCLIEVSSLEAASTLYRRISAASLPVKFLGAGSNLLIPDAGLDIPVIRLGRQFNYFKPIASGIFEVGAATSLMRLSRTLSEEGFSGTEFAGGIPASIGGALRMNAGAHGSEVCNVLEEVTFVLSQGEVVSVKAKELSFSYRYSSIPKEALITSAKIRLAAGDRERSRQKRQEYLVERKSRQPLNMPSAGSVFKNPDVKNSAGRLIDQAGLKGSVVGGAKVSELHGNWIVNPLRTALAADVEALIKLCQERVQQASGIKLEAEIVRW